MHKFPALDDPQAFLRTLMRGDFRAFLRKAYPWIRGGDMIAWNWHLDAIAHQLDRVATGVERRLLVTMPPRNLKSITISVAWVAWMLGKDPRRNFVCVSYSNELSAKLARDCLAIMQSGWYRELFPSAIISGKRSASGDFETTKGGGRLATSVTGTLTGRGGDIIVIDDPIKPEEAHSETTRDFVNHWFQSTLASRLNDKASGAIIVVMQRLHQYDLAGMLIENGGWQQLSLPAIAPGDEAIALPRGKLYHRKEGGILHPDRESRAVLEQQRLFMGSSAFAAQYQQTPVSAIGNIVKADWLKTYPRSFEPVRPGQIVQSWDTASKEGVQNDYSVCITAHVHRSEVRILDVFRRKLTFPELKRHAIRLAREYKANALLIEDAASGTQLIQTLRAEQPRGMPLPIARKPEGDKHSRMAGVSGQIEAGQLLLPEDAPWLAEFKAELLGFPNARHDDQADALTQMMSWALRNSDSIYYQEVIGCGPILFYADDDGYVHQVGGWNLGDDGDHQTSDDVLW
jgi:predicted phage terminase large subunit-like protein